MTGLSPNATVDSRNDCPLRHTPRADALWKTWEKDPHGVTKYAAMFLLAKELENDLELCRDAHMANCLAADTLRTEIRRLRETLSATSFTSPAGLSPATVDLVARFATALADKLHKAEQKYGYDDGWTGSAWMEECQARLLEHVSKGDPRDVAAYCAFMWHHGWRTRPEMTTTPLRTCEHGVVYGDPCQACSQSSPTDKSREHIDYKEMYELERAARDENVRGWMARCDALAHHLRQAMRFMQHTEALGWSASSGILQAGDDKSTAFNVDEANTLLLTVAPSSTAFDEAHAILDKADISRKHSRDAGATWIEYSLAERINILAGGYKISERECEEAEARLLALSATLPATQHRYAAPFKMLGKEAEWVQIRFVAREHIKDSPTEANPSPIRVILVGELERAQPQAMAFYSPDDIHREGKS